MYESLDGTKNYTNVKAQTDAGKAVNIIYDFTRADIPALSNRTDMSVSGNATCNIVESITAIGISTSVFAQKNEGGSYIYQQGIFQGIKGYDGAKLTVNKNVTVQSGYFAINGFGTDSSKSFRVFDVNIKGQIIMGTSTALTLEQSGGRVQTTYGYACGPLNSLSVGYVADADENKVALDLSATGGTKSISLNVGAHDNGLSVTSIESLDVVFNGIIKGATSNNDRAFIYTLSRNVTTPERQLFRRRA